MRISAPNDSHFLTFAHSEATVALWPQSRVPFLCGRHTVPCHVSVADRPDAQRTGFVALSAQFVQQDLCIFQVGGIEAFIEPVVDLGEHGARLGATTLFREQRR
jgi:hypothetical protein